MKKFSSQVFVTVLAIISWLQASATVRTVNNGSYLPTNPGQYSTISAAISAASAGDTILVAGSNTYYTENPSIPIKLTIIGAGYNPQYGPATVLNGSFTFSNFNSAGSTIMGFNITGNINDNGNSSGTYNNITIFRNYIQQGISFGSGFQYLSIIENVIYGNGNPGVHLSNNWIQCQYVVAQNNIFLNDAGILLGNVSTSTPQMVIDHNLFLGGNYSNPSLTLYGGNSCFNCGGTCYYCDGVSGWTNYALLTTNALVTNNIFYGVVPIDTVSTSNYNYNSFNNNLTYCSATIKALPWGSNTGVSNINNTNPAFTSIFTSSTSPYLSLNNDNLRPQSGSPVLYAGSDSTNIGPTGGQYPIYDYTNPYLSGETRVPMVETITPVSSTSVHAGTPFVIQVTAKQIK